MGNSFNSPLIKGLSEDVPVKLRPSVGKHVGLLLISLLLAAVSLWIGTSENWLGYVLAAFFGLGIPIAILQFVPGSSYLLIEREGLTVRNLYRNRYIPWKDIAEFFVVKTKYRGITTATLVAFNYSTTYDRTGFGRRLAKALGHCEGYLPDIYGQNAAELADYLNYRLMQSRARSNTATSKGA
jgi:hypothetical protein